MRFPLEGRRGLAVVGLSFVLAAGASVSARPQAPGGATAPRQAETPAALAARAAARIRDLQAEADRLAAEARTVFGDLRRLEVDRQIQVQEVARVDAELAEVTARAADAAARLAALDAERVAATPGVRARLVEIYKRGQGGYLRLLLSTGDIRALGRMTRGVAAVAALDRLRLDAHRRRIRAERDALAELDGRRAEVERLQAEAVTARDALARAVEARERRIDDLDRQRDLAARYVGELQEAQGALQREVGALASGGAAAPALPLPPFRGALPWPVAGRVQSRFGRAPGRFATAIVRNGIEIAAAEGTPVGAVHGGTVAYAAPFTGFGILVIVDHGGGAFTLYGHLGEALVATGDRVARGATVGTVGQAPAGGAALYFELRIDGRPVDPLQWLRSSP
ncbi:MAG: murein hydrolase activator EnvC [Vicinamibacterales bacterium]